MYTRLPGERAGSTAQQSTALTSICDKTASFFEFSLCLSRACLGEMFVFIYKWRKKCRFLTSERMIFARSRTVMLPPSPTVTLALVSPRKTRSVRNLLSRAAVEPPPPTRLRQQTRLKVSPSSRICRRVAASICRNPCRTESVCCLNYFPMFVPSMSWQIFGFE